MIRFFSALLAALQSIADTLARCHELLATGVREWSGVEGFEQRLSTLEREVDKREAQADATLERAESKFKAARAAEERARHFANAEKRAENGAEDVDVDDEAIAAWLEAVRAGDAGGGEEEGVQPVRSRVGARHEDKAALRARKLGRQ